jgi:MFS family permease
VGGDGVRDHLRGFLLLGGRAGDLLGRRKVFLAGVALFTVASLACGLAPSDTFLIITRGVQGIGGAIIAPSALAIVSTAFPKAPSGTRRWACGARSAAAGLRSA